MNTREGEETVVEIEDEYEGCKKTHVLKHLGRLLPIDETDASDFDMEHFKGKYLQNNRPLVIRNALKVFDCGEAYANWSLDYLKEKCGSNRVYVRRNTLNDEYKTGKAYFVQEIDFKKYAEDLEDESPISRNSYLAVQNLKKAFHQIAHELKMPPFVEKLHAGPFLWIARSGHYEYTHMDPDDNALMVLRGRKLVRLYGCNVEAMNPNSLGSKGRTIQSQIDCDNFDCAQLDGDIRARFEQTDCHYCLLRESDCLYFPAFWWHQVKSPEKTISVNVFFGDAGDNRFIGKLLKSTQHDALMYWIYNIIKQNMNYPSFDRTLCNLKDSLRQFLFKQWHDSLDDAQLEHVYSKIIAHFGLEVRLKELRASEAAPTLEKKSKNAPVLRIRGLLMRPNDESKDDDED